MRDRHFLLHLFWDYLIFKTIKTYYLFPPLPSIIFFKSIRCVIVLGSSSFALVSMLDLGVWQSPET